MTQPELLPETHPLPAFAPENARLLMLGSFPPGRHRWKMDFYYPNLNNDMWRIMGLCFFNERDYFLTPQKNGYEEDKIRQFLQEKGIAISDTAKQVIRLKENASDKHLQIVQTMDIAALLERLPHCHAIVTTGQKASDTLLSILPGIPAAPAVGGFVEFLWQTRKMRFYRMPSSSRAYPKPLVEKAGVYLGMFNEIGL
ncbi:uracil-DNA glycosylase family protein [Advenella sp. WQ 585]|uniref:Uracil-DNA glycosylase family protein n=1 Tax=Advenella mandrilli TaxID=2800330 RepID=A0ABS1EC50_9BURK|nr:uracil-DNA glycosylase family protein [Advenella mandrilli]MBK1780179.1 uracil-DNA glycosylase family protein [Advenella mandrilli]